MRVGKTTHELSHLGVGDELADVVGPLGVPTHVEGAGRVAVVGGGVGAAVAYPVARAMAEAGSDVHVILGARNSELLVLEDELRALPGVTLTVMTDDGSAGEKGLVTHPLKTLCEGGAIDRAFAVGPAIMMKFCAATTRDFGSADHGVAQPDHGRRHGYVRSVPRVGGRRDAFRLRRRTGLRRSCGRLGTADEPSADLRR